MGISEGRLVTCDLSINSPCCLLAKGPHCITQAILIYFDMNCNIHDILEQNNELV